jgi:TusA-related sulfurtransferase
MLVAEKAGALREPDQLLDISGEVIPFSLALCKCTLARMAAGAVLKIRLRDQETLQDLMIILERSGDQVLSWERHEEHYYLWVRKSPIPLPLNQVSSLSES